MHLHNNVLAARLIKNDIVGIRELFLLGWYKLDFRLFLDFFKTSPENALK